MIKVGWNSHDEFSSVYVFDESCSFHRLKFLITVIKVNKNCAKNCFYEKKHTP